MSPDSGPRDEKVAIVWLLRLVAATARPLATLWLRVVELRELPAAQTTRTSAVNAHASSACWLACAASGLPV